MLELASPRYLDGAVPWSPLPLPDLLVRDAVTRHYLPALTPAALAAGLTVAGAGVWQELTPGLPLRVWLSGDGTTVATTVAAPLDQPAGSAVLPRTGSGAQTVTTYTAAFRVRVGDGESWDDAAPVNIAALPAPATKSLGHAHDPKRDVRRSATQQWLKGWGDLLTRFAPRYPLVVTGVIVGSAVSGSGLGSLVQHNTFLAQEVYVVAEDYWLGWDELVASGLPVMPARVVPSDPTALIATLAAATAAIFPFHTVPIDGLVLRPAAGRDRTRFVAYRDAT